VPCTIEGYIQKWYHEGKYEHRARTGPLFFFMVPLACRNIPGKSHYPQKDPHVPLPGSGGKSHPGACIPATKKIGFIVKGTDNAV
jgi:hypothetical protein